MLSELDTEIDAIFEAFGLEAEFDFGTIVILLYADYQYLDSRATPFDLSGLVLTVGIKYSDVQENSISSDFNFTILRYNKNYTYKIISSNLEDVHGIYHFPIKLISTEDAF